MSASSLPQDVLYAAADWYATIFDEHCTDEERHNWQLWLQKDRQHQEAWRQVEQIHARFQQVVHTPSAVLTRPAAETSRRSMLKLLLLAGVGGVAGYALPWKSYAADYRTGVGETRHLILHEGMQVWLNTDSALNVQNDGNHLQLIKGELALKSAGKNDIQLASRCGKVTLTQPGTLTLRTESALDCLSVFEGEAWLGTNASQALRRIPAGQQVVFTPQQIHSPVGVDAFRQSWISGMLVADRMRLDRFIDEISRYQTAYFNVDPAVAGLLISGVFPLRETQRILAALTRSFPLQITTRLSWWVDIRAKGK
ncbi:DUF4880 domain-containing protein [Edaphovirga cremea]|uniref:DUF4880 domain-containing protein n=1 Tax=Edaphovirga cremea TaxID=2267246 RepID=UPI001FEA4B5B|nr:DUF4880 domain-containing protein [Edaphovirga cremea]